MAESGQFVHDRYGVVAWSDLFCLSHADKLLGDTTSAFLEVIPNDPKDVNQHENLTSVKISQKENILENVESRKHT